MDTAAPVPRVRHASVHMEAMGLWRPPHSPGGPARDFVHPGPPENSFCVNGLIPCKYVAGC